MRCRATSVLTGSVIATFGGCGFEVPGPQAGIDGGNDVVPGIDAGSVIAERCQTWGMPADPSIRLCLDFEDSFTTIVRDGSGLQHDASAEAVTTMPRTGELAARVDTASRLRVPESVDLIASKITFGMWIHPDLPIPDDAERGLLAYGARYRLTVEADNQITCRIGDDEADTKAEIPINLLGTWTHVACTFDGNELRAYVAGSVAGCRRMSRFAGATTGGLAIGARLGDNGQLADQFVGGIDDVHIYARSLSPSEICSAAGGANCSAMCPPGGPGGDGD
ncbi:MAG: LamG domain-containing protein [Kofleriaceae bacterium]